MNLPFVLALVTFAALMADLVWYCLGRYRGGRVLKLLCRISLEPESCVRRTEDMFARHGYLLPWEDGNGAVWPTSKRATDSYQHENNTSASGGLDS